MKLAIIGSRSFNDYDKLKNEVDKIKDITTIISGGAKGADTLAEKYAFEKNIPIKIFPANWSKFGKQAGIIRNKEIIDNCDKVIAFWDGESRGTKNSITVAKNKGKEVILVYY